MFGHLTYLVFELVWSAPVILAQAIVGWHYSLFRRKTRVLALGIIVPAVYFSVADAVAIGAHIWTINPTRTMGLWLGPLPLEEVVFFLVTSAMTVQGIILLVARWDDDRPALAV